MSHNSYMHLVGGLAAAGVLWLSGCAEVEVVDEIEEVREPQRIEVILSVQGPEDIEEAIWLYGDDVAMEDGLPDLEAAGDPDIMVEHGDCFGGHLLEYTEIPKEHMPTHESVSAGLDWLKNHQSPEGFWDADRFMEQDEHKDLAASSGAGNLVNDVGLTGLAFLAMLGDGSTTTSGPYKENLKTAFLWLEGNQDKRGLFGKEVGNATLYNHAIATLAMSEACLANGKHPVLKRPVTKSVGMILSARNPYGAWRYSLSPNGDSDTSVTGWMVMALTSAKDCGVEVDDAVFDGAKTWFDLMRNKHTGRVGYAWGEGGGGPGSYPVREPWMIDAFPAERSEALTAVALFAQMLMTDRVKVTRWEDHPDYEMMKKQVDLILAKPPVWDEKGGYIDLYYWYFGTLAMYQWGGEECMAWVDAAAKAVLAHQRLENEHDNFFGSWDPVGPWGKQGGRIYSTALCTLILEVHFRHAKLISNE